MLLVRLKSMKVRMCSRKKMSRNVRGFAIYIYNELVGPNARKS
jgi:hypothetical protein